jgi:hypothetical protein
MDNTPYVDTMFFQEHKFKRMKVSNLGKCVWKDVHYWTMSIILI